MSLSACDSGFGTYVDNLTSNESSAEILKLQGDVRSTVQTIQGFLVTNPTLSDVATVPGSSSNDSGYSIKSAGSYKDWKVVGTNKADTYAYVYDSKTQTYKEVTS